MKMANEGKKPEAVVPAAQQQKPKFDKKNKKQNQQPAPEAKPVQEEAKAAPPKETQKPKPE